MGSGALVGFVLEVMPPGANAATVDVRAGGSTPAENLKVRDYDAATIEYTDCLCRLEGYAGGGLTVKRPWSASTATSGVTRWGGAFRRIELDTDDIDASHTYAYNDVDDTAASASGEPVQAEITFTDGADMDSLADGDTFIYRERRNATHANDTMAGDAETWGPPIILET